jgi:hypothetical protein
MDHMDLLTLGFFVIPAWFLGVGVIFLLIWGNDFFRRYDNERHLQHEREPWKTYEPIVQKIDREARHAPQSRKVEELVGSH